MKLGPVLILNLQIDAPIDFVDLQHQHDPELPAEAETNRSFLGNADRRGGGADPRWSEKSRPHHGQGEEDCLHGEFIYLCIYLFIAKSELYKAAL